MTQQNALVWEGGNVVAVRPVAVPESRPGWVAVDVAYAGICGSDLHVAAGEHVRAQPGTILGHEFIGHLAEPYGDLALGQPVFVNPIVHCGVCEACLAGRTNVCRTLTLVGIDYPGAIAPRTVVPEYGIYPLPADVDLVAAALIEPVAVAVRVSAHRPGLHGIDLLSVMFAEITIIGTRIYQRSDIEAAIELVTTGTLDARRLISKIFPLDEAVTAVDSLRRAEGMKVLIKPGQTQSTLQP
jgi:threonine dehydrogenase-like Zn-dependent dehydrogenase